MKQNTLYVTKFQILIGATISIIYMIPICEGGTDSESDNHLRENISEQNGKDIEKNDSFKSTAEALSFILSLYEQSDILLKNELDMVKNVKNKHSLLEWMKVIDKSPDPLSKLSRVKDVHFNKNEKLIIQNRRNQYLHVNKRAFYTLRGEIARIVQDNAYGDNAALNRLKEILYYMNLSGPIEQ